MILFFVIATNLVNIVRPFPIGWDDLGVYMNFPKLMAYALSTSNQGMVFWQTFTGIGFLFDSPTQAFFLNQVGSFLTIVTLYSGISYFTSKKPNLLPYPLIATTIFCSMPMVVFQQAKDMKLDPALFGVSIISLLLVFLALSSEKK